MSCFGVRRDQDGSIKAAELAVTNGQGKLESFVGARFNEGGQIDSFQEKTSGLPNNEIHPMSGSFQASQVILNLRFTEEFLRLCESVKEKTHQEQKKALTAYISESWPKESSNELKAILIESVLSLYT